jgi:rhodanese-related sulfurtransferase
MTRGSTPLSLKEKRMPSEITAKALQARLDAGEKLLLLDVRQPWEHETARIAKSVLIPMNELPQRLADIKLEAGQQLVTYCHAGVRSMRSAMFLEQSGFTNVLSLAGGIAAWSSEVDPTVPQY